MEDEQQLEGLGAPSPLTCPECGGVLYQLTDERLLRFRCRAGHAMSGRTLLARLSTSRENAMWSLIRSLTEEVAVIRRLAEGPGATGEPLLSKASPALELAHRLRTILTDWPSPVDGQF